MDIKQLRCFMAVAENLNFTKAANQLFVTQSAVSYQIAGLEKQLDLKLFVRDRHTVQLTAAGEVLYQESKRLVAEFNEAVDKARMTESGMVGRLSIGILSSFKFLPSLIKKFRSSYPSIAVTVTRHSMNQLNDALKSGELDLIFTITFAMASLRNVRSYTFLPDQAAVFVRPDHPLASKERVSILDLKKEPMVHLSADSSASGLDWTEKICRKRGFAPNIVQFTDDLETLLFMIDAGLGITILAKHALGFYPNFKLKAIPLEDADAAIEGICVWKDRTSNPSVPLFLRKLGVINPNDV
nr:LysR family transcriptional regulator [uncultured Holophaga sp.]